MAGPIEAYTVLRAEEKYQDIVQHHEHKGEAYHEAYVTELYLRDTEKDESYDGKDNQYPGIIGHHGGKGPEYEAHKLGCPCQFMDGRLSRYVVKEVLHFAPTPFRTL